MKTTSWSKGWFCITAGIALVLITYPKETVAQNTFPTSGNAGAGTNNPTAQLSVLGSSSDPSLTNDTAVANIKSSSTVELTFGGQAASPYSFWMQTKRSPNDGYSYPLVFNPLGGRVGVGTNSPGAMFDVANSTGNLWSHWAHSTAATGQNYGILINAGTNSSDYSFRAQNASYSAELFAVRGDGNVGIGTASPGYPLQVTRSATDQYLGWFENTQSSPGTARLRVQNTATQGSFEIDVTANGNTLFQTGKSNNSPTLSILTGNVGIGTTSPVDKLNIAGNAVVDPGNSFISRYTSSTAHQGHFSWDHIQLGNNGANYIVAGGGGGSGAGGALGFVVNNTNELSGLYAHSYKTGTVAMFITSGSYVGVGTTAPNEKLEVEGNLRVSGTNAGNITATGTIDANIIKARYQDVAEWVPASEQLPAGTVVVLDSTKSNQVISSSVSYDTRVAGVISAQPGIALGEQSDSKVLVATTGRVKVKVDASKGPIHIGDLLVTSDVPGVAMKSEAVNLGGVQIHRPGTLIGKALEPLEKGKGEILVLLSLQ